MKAIQTKYLSPTNTKGARIKAFDFDGNSITIPHDYECNDSGAYYKAACAFLDKMRWQWDRSKIVNGAVKGGYVFCYNPRG